MSNGQTFVGEGSSMISFREAAKSAIHHAELQHAGSGTGGDPPEEYELTFKARAKKGHSLSEYIVVAKGSI